MILCHCIRGQRIDRPGKKTEPFGYIVKPFNEREIQSNIEIALYRHKMEQEIKKRDAILLALGSGIEWFLRQFANRHTIVSKQFRDASGQPDFPILESIGNAMNLQPDCGFQL